MTHAQRFLLFFVSMTVLGLALSSCQHEDAALAPAPTADKFVLGDGGLAEYLALLDDAAETYTYETAIEAEIDVVSGGTATGYPPSWGPDFSFSMAIPPGAIDTDVFPGPTVTITVKVPVMDTVFPCESAPMPVVFEPSGLDFLVAMELTVNLHPSLDENCYSYEFFYVETVDQMPQILTWGGFQHAVGGPPDCGVDIGTWVKHFSRWHMAQGKVDTTTTSPETDMCP